VRKFYITTSEYTRTGVCSVSSVLGVFEPHTKTIREIFGGTNYYLIPDYQRPYSWEDEQIERLWDDIFSAFDEKDKYYFLGPTILARTNTGDLEVVDGQQRLTTLTILFCILRDFHFKDFKGKDRLLKNQVSNAIFSMVEDKYRLRLITQAHYQNQFEHEVLKNVILPQNDLTKSEKRKLQYKFMNAAMILKKKLDELCKESGIAKVKNFMSYIMQNVVMVTITCSNRVSAIKLFQIINTTGLELSLADLVKSSLFSRLETEKHKQFVATWQNIESLAENNDESVSDLLTYYAYYLLATKPKKSLYEELESRFKRKNSNRVVYDFKKFVEHYDEMVNKKSKVIYSLKYLPDKVFWKAILTTARKEGFRKFRELCRKLRNMYYLYWIAGYTTAKTRNFSFKLINRIKAGDSLGVLTKEINKQMKDDDVFKHAKDSLAEDCYEKKWLKPLLIVIEYEQTDESVFIPYSRNLHVDHILPQEWMKIKYWKRKWKEEEADDLLGTIGNLTLLSGRKNIRASNDSFPNKKKIYKGKGIDGKTAFEISKRILRNSDWTTREVTKRRKWLIGQAKRIFSLYEHSL